MSYSRSPLDQSGMPSPSDLRSFVSTDRAGDGKKEKKSPGLVETSLVVSEIDDRLVVNFKQTGKKGRIIATFIIILFLVHPTITSVMFSAFK